MLIKVGRFLRCLVLALLPVAVLAVGVELALMALDVGEPGQRLNMSRGFDRSAGYLVPDPENPGGWHTQMFEVEHLEITVPPKSDRRRLVMVGGSNTQGFPSNALAQKLDAADPDHTWEVVNLGRSGYGSERVSILLDQAIDLEPDVVLVYTGHNEFMEVGFRKSLAAQGALSTFGRAAQGLGDHLRVMNVLMDAFEPELTDRSVDRRPELRQKRAKTFDYLTYTETRTFYEAYASNLQKIAETVLDAGVGLVLCTLASNEFVGPYTPKRLVNEGATLEESKQFKKLLKAAGKAIPARFRLGLLDRADPNELRRITLSQPDWGITLRPEEIEARLASPPAAGRTVPTLRRLGGPLGKLPETNDPKATSIAGAHWPDPSLWMNKVFDLLETMEALHEREPTSKELAALRRADSLFGQALEIAPDAPRALFGRGLCAYVLGEDARARKLFTEAVRYDRAPHRATGPINNTVRELADTLSVDGVTFVDVEALFRARSPSGLVGYEIMTDVCHIQPGARLPLMDDFVPAILSAAYRTNGR